VVEEFAGKETVQSDNWEESDISGFVAPIRLNVGFVLFYSLHREA
jgi:hypothetical protein